MKKLIFPVVLTLLISTTGIAKTVVTKSNNLITELIETVKRYAVKAVIHLGILGAYGFEFEFEWPIAPPSDNPFESESAQFNKNGTLTIAFNQKFPVDVLVIEKAVVGKQLSDSGCQANLVIAPGKYKVVNGNTVTFNLQK